MSCEEDVARIAKKLEKMVNGKREMDTAMELIEALSNLPINVDILTKTRIGMIINELRKKTTDEKLSKKAKSLIKSWKSLLDTKASASSTSSASKTKKTESADSDSPVEKKARSSENTPEPVTSLAKPNFPIKHNGIIPTGDELREKSAEMLNRALRVSDLPDGTLDPEEIAFKIEKALFEVHRGTNDKYKAALRSRVFNLRDKNNPALRENVLTGAVAAEKFAVMTPNEMASNEMKEARTKFTKQAIEEHQMSINEGTPSDLFRCGKCGKRNCTYTQVQTRSADEPMTTFVFCRDCGNRWKFC
uniref:Transcription elongation factor n=1 Tax=Ditylenchus dipsaci TaxID=166011 RepID=A0A915ELE2_9BILA